LSKSHGHNDNISETVLETLTGHLTGNDTHIQPIQQQQW